MADPIVACVRTGSIYPMEYVIKLRNMVGRHMRQPYMFYCLTDQPERCEGAAFVDITEVGLPGWWAKMLLFEPAWRGTSQIIFFDLDTVIIGDVSPLLTVPGEFAICESFTRLAGNSVYPCRYNSSCMVIGAGQCSFMWGKFDKRREYYIARHAAYGDQAAIEELYPHATFLQNLMPKGFFANYRHLTMLMPQASVVNFGGRHKPHNCPIPWVRDEWA